MGIKIGNYCEKLYSNKYVLKGLEKISEHGTSFVALTSFVMATTVRPVAISLTPDTKKENKQYAVANSLGSGLMKLAMVEAVALPVENAIKNIDKNPEKYLNKKTLKIFLKDSRDIASSKSYKYLTQFMKLGAGLVMAVPKSVLTVALIPLFLFGANHSNSSEQKGKDVSFTGLYTDRISKVLAKFINNEKFQNFAVKNDKNDKNLAKYMTAVTDTVMTLTTAFFIGKSRKIEEERKKPLIYNNIISAAITIAGGLSADRLVKRLSSGIVENFKKANAGNPKLSKYIEGINILRPTLIFAGIYYGILPIFSTYISEKIDNYLSKKSI